MKESSHAKRHNIYMVDRDKAIGILWKDEIESGYDTSVVTYEAMISRMINMVSSEYKEQKLTRNQCSGYQLQLFAKNDVGRKTSLARFCEEFVESGELVVEATTGVVSSLLFIWKDLNLFIISSGYAHNDILPFILNKFGLIAANLFEDSFGIRSLNGNMVTGVVHSNSSTYIKDLKREDIDNLDTYYRSVSGRINDKAIIQELLDEPADSKRTHLTVAAKDNISFGVSMDLYELINLIGKLDRDYSKYRDIFNNIIPLTAKQDSDRIQKLQDCVLEAIAVSIKEGSSIPFDIFHKNEESFLKAETYALNYKRHKFETMDCLDMDKISSQLFEGYKRYVEGGGATELEYFRQVGLSSFNDKICITKGSLLEHISGEIDFGNDHYFIFYGEFFYLKEEYCTSLNRDLKNKIAGKEESILQSNWPANTDEDWYNNESQDVDDNIFMFHKIKPDGIEFADHIKFDLDDDGFWIMHVKDGFDSKMRDLYRQVEMSIRKLQDLKVNADHVYMKNVYAQACNRTTEFSRLFPSFEEFVDYLKNKTPHYGIVIRPSTSNIFDSRSNIAKHCLRDLIITCGKMGIDFKVQIVEPSSDVSEAIADKYKTEKQKHIKNSN